MRTDKTALREFFGLFCTKLEMQVSSAKADDQIR